jgi:hypothetical protein
VNFRKSTSQYEAWLSQELEIVPADLKLKHEAMRKDIFSFLRATFYRWCQLWPEVCPECDKAPQLLAVGDLHVENFGTWRDVEGRLVWGINDFDEVCRMPYTIDLVRLGASAHLAIDTEQLRIPHSEACDYIVAGYKECLEKGGLPWVIAGRHAWLRDMVGPALRDPILFWRKLEDLPAFKGRIPGNARRGLNKLMPGKTSSFRFAHRVAGLGSLGRQRFIAIADYQGGLVCREAKALAPSAWCWAGQERLQPIRYQRALDTAVRAVDPFVRLQGRWIVRRLAPDCTRIDLAEFPNEKDESRLLRAMGWETGNVHLASSHSRAVLADLAKRPKDWLHKAASAMVKSTKADWEEWRANSSKGASSPKPARSAKAKAH